MALIYDKEKCTGCMLCPKVCNFGAISKDGQKVKFDFNKCVLCGSCVDVCPVDAIKSVSRKENGRNIIETTIDQDECVECYVCYRSGICSKEALEIVPLRWPRSIRHEFSDPNVIKGATGVGGRGTEEMKTNDITGRYGFGEVGFTIDVGRPNGGTSLVDVEKVAKAVARVGAKFEPSNPVTLLMTDKERGLLPEEVRNERVLSCVIEFKIPEEELHQMIRALENVANEIETVFSVGCISRVKLNGQIPVKTLLDETATFYRLNGKTNVGLGGSREIRAQSHLE
jgi:ferredoxin